MPPATAVEADVLLDHDTGLQVDRGFDSDSPLALPTPHGVSSAILVVYAGSDGGAYPVQPRFPGRGSPK